MMRPRRPGDGHQMSRGRDWRRGFRLTVLASALALMIADVQAQSPGDPAAAASPGQTAPSAPLAGWSTFQIKKSQAELTETARLADDSQVAARTGLDDLKPPPQRDLLRVSTGIGYLQGADWGGDISATGKFNGMQTDVSTFFTAGPMGLQSTSGHVSIFAL